MKSKEGACGGKVYCFAEIEEGMEFKPTVWAMKEDTIIKYCDAVHETSPIFYDLEEANNEGFPAIVVPPTTAAIYAFRGFLEGMNLPPGSLYATQEFDFKHPAMAGDVLTTTSKILRKFETKGRKHVIVEAITKNQNGRMVVVSRMGAILAE